MLQSNISLVESRSAENRENREVKAKMLTILCGILRDVLKALQKHFVPKLLMLMGQKNHFKRCLKVCNKNCNGCLKDTKTPCKNIQHYYV